MTVMVMSHWSLLVFLRSESVGKVSCEKRNHNFKVLGLTTWKAELSLT